MIEHSVPQNVTSYQFHLIGNMTIKQFLLLLGGVGVAGILYTTNIIGIIKWPLIILFILIGIALAFVPFEERSLDQWVMNFIRAMYRPTKFFWRRMGSAPELFEFTPRSNDTSIPVRPGLTTANRRRQVNQYLNTLKPASQQNAGRDPLDMLDTDTSAFNDLFSSVTAAKNVVPSENVAVKPKLGVRSRPLKEQTPNDTSPTFPTQATLSLPVAPPQITIEQPLETTVEKPNESTIRHPGETTLEAIGTVSVPSIEPTIPEPPAAPAIPIQTEQTTYAQAVTPAALPQGGATIPVVFNRSLPFPSLPDKPNILIGMVYNQAGSILANAILEIINDQGNTVRALKTNSLGQFYTSTPLPAGDYVIETEMDGFVFPRFALHTENQVLDPIEIRPTSQA